MFDPGDLILFLSYFIAMLLFFIPCELLVRFLVRREEKQSVHIRYPRRR